MTGTFKHLRLVTAMVLAVLMVVLIPVQAGAIVLPEMTAAENQISGTQGGAIDAQEEETKPAKILAEVTEDRDEYTKHFRMDDGSFMAVQYEYPVHYQDKNGEWVDYDNSMKEVETQPATDTPTEPEKPASSTEPAPSATEKHTASAASIDASAATAAVSETEAASIEATEAETETATDAAEPASLNFDENTEYKNKKSDLDIRLSKKAKKNNMVKIKGDGYQVSWGFAGVNKSRVEFISNDEKLEGNDKFLVRKNLVQEALYKNAFPNVDLQYLVTPVGVKENIILKNKDAQTEFEIAYKIKGLTAEKKNDFTIVLKDKDGKAVYEIYAPFMTDAKGEKSTQLQMEIKNQETNKLTVVLSADKEWLGSSERVYPVIIDPSFTTSQSSGTVASTYVDSNYPTTAYGKGSETGYSGTLNVGSSGFGKYRTFVKIANLPDLNKGDIIIDARMNLLRTNEDYYDTMNVYTYQVSESWKQSTVTWNNQPQCENIATDYSTITVNQESGWQEWNVTKNVKRWYNGEANYGIVLKAKETGNSQTAEYISANYPQTVQARPIFLITYRNNKGLEDYWTYTSFDVGTAGTAYINDYTGNLVFVHQDATTPGDNMPLTINHVYNNYMAGRVYDKFKPLTGKGWRISIQQTVLPSSEFGLRGDSAKQYPYVYTDGDGTDHYFYKTTVNGVTTYLDEDGLKYKLTINTGSNVARYKITDDKGNSMEFNQYGLLVKIIDRNGNYDYVKYDTDNKTILYVQDGAGRRITFVPNPSGSGSLSQMKDPAGRTKIFNYPSAGLLDHIDYAVGTPDATTIYFTYDSDGALTSVKDVDGYMVKFGYSSKKSGKQVTSIQEYGKDGTVGQKITFDRTQYNTTEIHSAGVDGVYSSDYKGTDDLITTKQFDNFGRTVSIKSKTGKTDLGAAGCQFTTGSPNSSGSNVNQINRITNEYSLGSNTINLLTNGNMESSTTWKTSEWGGSTTFTGAYTTAQKYLGKKSYNLTVTNYTGLSIGRVYQEFSNTVLVPGSTYTLSAYVKTTGLSTATAKTGAMIAVNSLDASGAATNFFSDFIKSSTDTNIDGGWRRLSVTFKVPDNSAKTRINLGIRGAVGTAYFDAVQLEKYAVPNPYNMLENSSLDNYAANGYPIGWTGTDLTISSTGDGKDKQKQNGSYAFRVVGAADKNKEIIQSVNITGTEDDTYIVSGWAKANAVPENDDKTRRFKISVKVTYSDGSINWRQAAEFNRSISDWQFASSAFNLDDGTSAKKTPVKITVYVRYHQQANTCFFDNIQLIKDVSSSYTYDSKGNITSVQSNAQQKASMEYNNTDLTKSINPKGYSYIYNYDSKHNVKTATTQKGITYNYTYGSKGNPTKLEVKNPNKEAILQTTAEYSSDRAYTLKTTDQDGVVTENVYNVNTGTIAKIIDGAGTVKFEYNANNDLNTKVSKDVEEFGTTISTAYQYSDKGKNLSKITRNGNTYSYAYDSFGQKTQSKIGNQVLSTFAFGAKNGVLQKITYGNGQYVGYSYNDFGDVSAINYNGTTAFKWFNNRQGALTRLQDLINGIQYDNDYDITGRLVRQNAVSTTNKTNLFSLEFGYDENNNVKRFVNITSNKTARNSYVYGMDNLIEKYTIDDSRDVNYSYDSLNRLTKKSIATTTPIDMEYKYYLSDRNTAADNRKYKTTNLSEETIAGQQYSYEYDDAGNIVQINKKMNGTYKVQHYYEYDGLGQLIYDLDYDNKTLKQYDYDEGGNLLSEQTSIMANGRPVSSSTKQYGYSDSNWKDKMTSYDGQTITYDAIGNPLFYRDGMTMTWKNGRQLASLSKDGSTISYSYDADGYRVSKTVNGTKYTYQYVNGKLIHETRGQQSFNYYYDSTGYLTAIKYRLTPTGTEYSYYVTHNSRGDVLGIYSGSGVLTAQYEYDSWGNVLSVKNASGAEITDPNNVGNLNPFRYRGYYLDSETGLYYLLSRYYDSITHRFINSDNQMSKTGQLGGYNLFAYCVNNPINISDPTGQWPDWGAIIGGVITAAIGVAAIAAVVVTAGAATPLVAVGLAAVATAGVACVVNGVSKVVGGFTGTNPIAKAVGQNNFDRFDSACTLVAGAGAGAIMSTPYYQGATGSSSSTYSPPPRSRVYTKAVENAGVPFKTGMPHQTIQEGVDPNTLIMGKQYLGNMKPNDIANAVKYAGGHCIQVSKDGEVLNGHHRVVDAINNGRAVDVIIQ